MLHSLLIDISINDGEYAPMAINVSNRLAPIQNQSEQLCNTTSRL